LYGSIDAAKVPIEPRYPREKEQAAEAWRDLKVGCWHELTAAPASHQSSRQQAKAERDQAVYRAKNLRYS
jgi:hypothetical protein